MILKSIRESFKSKNSETSYIELKDNSIIIVINGQKVDLADLGEILCIYWVSYPYGFLIDDLEDPFYILELPGRYWVVPASYLDTEKLIQYCFTDKQVLGKSALLLTFPWNWREKNPFLWSIISSSLSWGSLEATKC